MPILKVSKDICPRLNNRYHLQTMSVFKSFRAVINQANEKAQTSSFYPIRRNLCKARAPNYLVLLKSIVISDWFYILENINIYFKPTVKLKKNRIY